jgi:transcriptional regulator with XRE-family HTH domain
MKYEQNGRKTDMLATVATTGEKLKRERRGEGLTQVELAERSGVAQSTIAQIEGGARPTPHPGTLKKLAEALGIETRDLLPDE